MRVILGITGIRSEYDIMSSVFKAIDDKDELCLQLIVTGAHLSESYGQTIDEIKSDRFEIVDKIESLINGDRELSRVVGLAVQLQSLAQSVARIMPDMLLVLGDREEAITTAIVGSYLNIPVAHVAGGDRVVGNVDDQVRHAVTKLAHLHFVTNYESAERIKKLGEQEFRIYDVGNPGLDRLINTPNLSHRNLSRNIGFDIADNDPLILLIQHPLSTEIEHAYEQMKVTLEAVKILEIKTVLTYPNSDAGGQQMIRAISDYEKIPNLHVMKHIPRLEFVNLMRYSSCILGNSSAGILEAQLFKIPVINVGNRQKERLHASNVQFVPHITNRIVNAVKTAVFDADYRKDVANCTNPYGDGKSSNKIAEVLANIEIDKKLMVKDITY